jgi:VCBS repeat-containing protein
MALPLPVAASSAPPARARKSPNPVNAVRRSTATHPVSVVTQPLPQHISADAAVADPLRTFFGNTTPALAPSQTGQSAGGVVTGLLNASDPDSAALAYRVVAGPARGTVTVGVDGTYTYAADPAFAATGTTDSFRVSVSDAGSGFHLHGLAGLLNVLTFGLIGSSGHTRETTVPVVVTPFGLTNTAPTGTPIIDTTNTITGTVTGRVVGVDADRDVLTYTASATTPKGSVSLNATSGAFTYQPGDSARRNAAAVGATDADRSDTFTVTVADGRGGSAGVVVTVPVIPVSVEPSTPLPAFPGAEGFGASATGGRGGSVIYVTNLDADGPGSLQWAIDQPGARYILFKVSGVINTQIHLTNGDVTIAGQTSPGGITLRGFVTDESPFQDQDVRAPSDFAENWILQHIRIRPGANGPSDDGLRLRYTRNAIVDHVSIGNATDEAVEISYSRDITVQNSVIAETVGGHSFYGGVLMNYSNPAHGFGLDNIALHHNVFNRIEGRLPEGSRESLSAAGSYMNLELSNNLYWDPNFFIALGPDTGTVTGPSGPYPIYWNLNAVNNFFQIRNGFPYGMFDDQIMRTSMNRLYVSGNQMSGYAGRSDYELFYCCNDYPSVIDPDTGSQVAQKLSARHPFPAITYTPTGQLRTVLLNTAGAWPRDPMDTRLMQNVATNTIASAPRNTNPAGDALLTAYTGSAPPPPQDTDNDGMPDSWETAKGLNPTVANTNARTLSAVGYTDLEVYLQELSGSRISGWNAG